MAKLISLRLDVSKIDKSRLFEGKKGTYLDLTVSVNDQADDYGNNVACWQGQTKEEVQNKAGKNYLGNGKVFWSNESKVESVSAEVVEEQDDLPF